MALIHGGWFRLSDCILLLSPKQVLISRICVCAFTTTTKMNFNYFKIMFDRFEMGLLLFQHNTQHRDVGNVGLRQRERERSQSSNSNPGGLVTALGTLCAEFYGVAWNSLKFKPSFKLSGRTPSWWPPDSARVRRYKIVNRLSLNCRVHNKRSSVRATKGDSEKEAAQFGSEYIELDFSKRLRRH